MNTELPHNLENEKAVLGSILLNRDAIVAVANWLEPEMFYARRHEMIYKAMLTLFEKRTPPDTRLVSDELKRREQLDQVGGILYLSDMLDSVPTSYHVEHYARRVESAAMRRKLIQAGAKAAALGYDETKNDDEVRASALALVTEAATPRDDEGETAIGDLMSDYVNRYGQDRDPAISTGLYDLDSVIYGISSKGRLITIAGRPGHGKTAFAMTIACNVARQDKPGLFFSMEMSRDELIERALSMHSGIDGKIIQGPSLTDEEFRAVMEAAGACNSWPLHIRAGDFSLADIRTRTLQHIAQHGPLAFIVVDYVGLVRPANSKGFSRQQQIGEITRGLKALAMETHTDVLMLAQLNREIEGRESKIPTLSDLREAGDIEQDSNIVIFVINPEALDPGTADKGKGIIYVQKHRGGPKGKVELTFNAPLTRFDNCERFREMPGY